MLSSLSTQLEYGGGDRSNASSRRVDVNGIRDENIVRSVAW